MIAANSHDHRYGMVTPQPKETLPKSKTPPQQAVRFSKEISDTGMHRLKNNLWELNYGWKLTDCDNVVRHYDTIFSDTVDPEEWLNAVVPGTVLTSLVDNGVYPDPYYGLNNMSIPDSICRTEWWYRVVFNRPEYGSMKKAWLTFEGINYMADCWMNSLKLGTVKGAFARGRFDVTDFLKEKNTLAVKIYPPNNPGIPHEQSMAAGQGHNGGILCIDGPTFISSEGWDWIPGIRDRNMGIWQPVTLKYTGDIVLGDNQVITDLPLPCVDYADLTINTSLENTSTYEKDIKLRIKLGGKELLSAAMRLHPFENRELSLTPSDFEALRVYNPRLWWPNGYGKQELYDMEIEVYDGDLLSDVSDIRFGIREYSYILSADDSEGNELRLEYFPTNDVTDKYPFDSSYRRSAGDGGVVVPKIKDTSNDLSKRIVEKDGCAPYLVICCNGRKIFCRGGNWGMDDGMKRVAKDRLEQALKLHKEQGFNMIRNWTGETTEELFYSLCDEYGMMVWNDFWISTEGANLEPADELLFMENATETVKRFRNHPSIAVWCPRNEGYAPEALDEKLSGMIAKEDGTRHYNPNSRYMNLRTSGPWHYLKDQSEYYKYHAKGFTTELGSPSVPTAESMRKFIPESERWPVSDTWCYHDCHSCLPHYCNPIDSLYGKSSSMEEFCLKAQMINYDSYRNMFEAWNAHMWDSTSGVLLWMSHPAWPSVEWQTYSWDFETPGAYFGSKKACEPIHVQMNRHNQKVVVTNLCGNIKKGKVVMSQFDSSGRLMSQKSHIIRDILSNTKTDIPIAADIVEGAFLLRLQLYIDKQCVSTNDYLLESDGNFKYLNDLVSPELSVTGERANSDGSRTFTVKNISKTPAVAVKFNIRNMSDMSAVLPTFFSEGYINLMPGESREVRFETESVENRILTGEGYNLPLTVLSDKL
ncbi:MAG: glycoside hydrolase family 2 [Muribaculaceae bacterium]|nr:glycoside hydrolase family 2 [Muribaculaceae bacterium]